MQPASELLEVKTFAKRRTCWTKFVSLKDLIFEFGALHERVNLVDPVESFLPSRWYLLAKIGFDSGENGPLRVCHELATSSKAKN